MGGGSAAGVDCGADVVAPGATATGAGRPETHATAQTPAQDAARNADRIRKDTCATIRG